MSQKTTSKDLINRVGSERALIGICLNKPDELLVASSEGLTPDMFAVDGHRYIFMAMAYLVDKGDSLDPISIMNVYTDENAKKSIEELGGFDYLEAVKLTPVASNTKTFTGHIIQASARRAIYDEAEKLRDKIIKDTKSSTNEVIGLAESVMRDIAIEYQVSTEVVKLGDGIGERLKQRALNPDSTVGIKTGWRQFDLATLGLIDGELTIVGARGKVGKSTVLLNWCRKIAVEDQIPTLYIDTEMYKEEQEDKLLSMISAVPHYEIRNGMFARDTINGTAREKLERVKHASKMIKDAPFYHVYLPHFTAEKVMALVRKYQVEFGIRLVVFDYIKLPSSGSAMGEKEYQALGYLTSSLKDLAGILQIPIISAVQLNRSAVGTDDFDSGMIAGSDRILQIANRVCYLRRTNDDEFTNLHGATHMFKIGDQRMGEPLDWTPLQSTKHTWRLEMMGDG